MLDSFLVYPALLIQQFLAKHKTIFMPQTPYSLDLDPCDFFLFPQTQTDTQRRIFFNYKWNKDEIAGRSQGDT